MIDILTVIVVVILVLIAVLHLIWGLKVWFPIKDERKLANAIAGFNGIDKMAPAGACFFVALCLFLAAALVLMSTGTLNMLGIEKSLVQLGSVGAILVFLIRGLFGYTRKWASLTPKEPFRTLDRRYYSPLCIFLGISMAAIVMLNN